MRTTLSEGGQTVVPSIIRQKFGMKVGQQIEWIEDGKVIHILPVPDEPVRHFQGSSHGLTRALLAHRKRKKERSR